MKAILSITPDNDLYLFNLPFAIYSWRQVGFEPIIMWTMPDLKHTLQWHVTNRYCGEAIRPYVEAPRDKAPTYAQCSRLYAAAIEELAPDEMIVTADADMCVFNRDYWQDVAKRKRCFHVIGDDLVSEGQFPMCYIMATVDNWRKAMRIGDRTGQQCLDDLLGDIEAENFRGNYWCKDQETAYQNIIEYCRSVDDADPIWFHRRAKPGTPFASRRADRDGWPDPLPTDILDAHLPRPGYSDADFHKIVRLFESMYPGQDLGWMWEYRKEYLSLQV